MICIFSSACFYISFFSEIVPNLKNVIQQVKDRSDELENKVNPNVQLGLS